MNKAILLIILVLCYCEAYSQKDNLISYNKGEIQIVTFKDTKPVDVRPIGLDAGLSYHSFFKYYVISYRNQNDQLAFLKLEYISSTGKSKRMRRVDNKDYYFVIDEKLTSDGLFLFRPEEGDSNISTVISGLRPFLEEKK